MKKGIQNIESLVKEKKWVVIKRREKDLGDCPTLRIACLVEK